MRDDPKWNIQFVKLVEKYPVLYDAGSEGYCSKDTVEEAWRKVASAMRESVINCKDKWRNLRTSLTRHLRNMNEPSALSGKYRRPYYMAPYMSFLIPYTKSRTYRSDLLPAEMPRRSSLDCLFDRRCPDRGGDSSSYDNSFGAIPVEDHETARPQEARQQQQDLEDHQHLHPHQRQGTARPHRAGPTTRGDRPSAATGDHHHDGSGGAAAFVLRRVQPKMEEPEEEVGGAAVAEEAEVLEEEGDGGDDVAVGEEEEDVEEDEDDDNMAAEEWEGGGARKRRRLNLDAASDEQPTTESAGPEGVTAGSDKIGANSAGVTSSRLPSVLQSGSAGQRPSRTGSDPWDSGPNKDMDEDSWCGWLRDGDWDACMAEEKRTSAKSSRGPSGGYRLRHSRAGLLEGRGSHLGTDQSNPDMDFFRSILSDVNSLTPSQRSKFRMSVLKSLHEMLYDES